MEIEVFVDADPFVDEPRERYRAVSAFFTYVSLSKEGKPLAVPQLLVRAFLSGLEPAGPSALQFLPGQSPAGLFVQEILFPSITQQKNMSTNETLQGRLQGFMFVFVIVLVLFVLVLFFVSFENCRWGGWGFSPSSWLRTGCVRALHLGTLSGSGGPHIPNFCSLWCPYSSLLPILAPLILAGLC